LGLTVPLLLLAGNKLLGVSSALRHVCAACFPANVAFLKYDWRQQAWSLFFAAGIVIGGFIGGVLLANPEPEKLLRTHTGAAKCGSTFHKGFLPQRF
jgi:uncharacterized membrane protein YfcA